MIICICNRLREQQIVETARTNKVTTVKELYRCLGCKLQCGKCSSYVQEEILETACHA